VVRDNNAARLVCGGMPECGGERGNIGVGTMDKKKLLVVGALSVLPVGVNSAMW
jgi:hypothetical protein